MAQLWYSPISINGAQVPSAQTDFPVLVSVTDARFKDVAHSGHVNRSDGFDIRPYTDVSLGTPIVGYELERYTPTTGEVVMWVKVQNLQSSTTPIVLGYGDTSITTDGSSATTWSNNFISVYHLKDGTTLSVADSVGVNNGTNHSATATAGKIDGGAAFAAASTQYIGLGTGVANSGVLTVSAWVNATSFPTPYNTATGYNNANTVFLFIFVKSTGKLAWSSSAGAVYDGTGTATLSAGTSYLLHWVSGTASSTNIGYVNASVDTPVGANGAFPSLGAHIANIGRDEVNLRYWDGMVDEVRYSKVIRSPNWITTEYNNQSAPSTFETLGAEASFIPVAGLFRL